MLIAQSYDWPMPWAIAVYTRDAAATLQQRGIPAELAGTIYSLSWNHVTAVADLPPTKRGASRAYQRRNISDVSDPALLQYVLDAPGLRPRNTKAEELHAWHPDLGDPPAWIWDKDLPKGTEFAVGLARWLAVGAPLANGFKGYKFLAIDEAQDLSPLELAAALSLLHEDGEALAVGDPGQAIFLGVKGVPEHSLPPAWEWATHHDPTLATGYRCGAPVSKAAANLLKPYHDRSADKFTAKHTTHIHLWDGTAPDRGLVLGMARAHGQRWATEHDLRDFAVSPSVADTRLTVCTIHAAKGAEADSVYLLPWSSRALERLDLQMPNALKVLYVGLTRAKKNLYLPADLFARVTKNLI